MNCKTTHTIVGNLMWFNLKRIFAFLSNMEQILHALYIPSGSEMLPFAGQVYQVATGMARRKKGLQHMKN